jgi:hypothetical protein
MRKLRNAALALLAVGTLSLATAGGSFAAPSRAAMETDKLTVNITKANGIVWGKVDVSYKAHGMMHMAGLCKQASCSYMVPHMVKLHLTETPKNKMTWPFGHWNVMGAMGNKPMRMGSKLVFEMTGNQATVDAVYHVKK